MSYEDAYCSKIAKLQSRMAARLRESEGAGGKHRTVNDRQREREREACESG